MTSVTTFTTISRVRLDASIEPLGRWFPERRVLELDRPGFPLLGAGSHQVEGELPWIFWDMCPSGYLGRRLQARRLSSNPRDWSASDCLRALTEAGHDLAGNLLVGEASVEAFLRWTFDAREVGLLLDEVLRDALTPDAPSSLGGERPKLLGYSANGEGYLMKFSPPPLTPQGVRWADLLRAESLCLRTLAAHGVNAADSRAGATRGRTTLHVNRFDRVKNRGRVGAATLYWLAMDRYGDVQVPAPEVLARLHAEGLVDAASVATCARVHAFSAAIGNTDAHLGNYGLIFDEAGKASLAPIYDVLPMALAPRNDELPDAYLERRTASQDPLIASWVSHLAQAMADEPLITDEFKLLWQRHVGC